MENSKIEWTHHTFNPWIGCTKISSGCLNCYAENLMDTRYGRVKWGRGNPRSRTAPANWRKPIQWNKAAEGAAERPRVFCASLADWLDDEVPIQWLSDLYDLICATPNLDWLLLTKRPENFRPRMEKIRGWRSSVGWWIEGRDGHEPPNVWLGTSAEDQTRWDERIPKLMEIPARVRFVSAEPLLGPIAIGHPGIDWMIVGGESGKGSRFMSPEWVVELRDQCLRAGIAFHFKQWSGVNKQKAGRSLDGRTWDELPA